MTPDRLLAVAGRPLRMYVSTDDGNRWETIPLPGCIDEGDAYPTGIFLQTEGALILGYTDVTHRKHTWKDDLEDAPGASLPMCVVRSLDNGKTWDEPLTLHEEWTGATRDIIETSRGSVLFTSMKMLNNPGRHSVLTYRSDDSGATWTASNVIDLGGCGHHGGASEATVVELKDGRLLLYIRTNWGRFWRSLSVDDGRHWHVYGPVDIDASSSPGMLMRLASGRIALAWNRWFPEGQQECPMLGGDNVFSATPVSIQRKELSVSFSEDDCESWSSPTVIGRAYEGEISYPYIFEPRPGVLWVTAHRSRHFAIEIREEDLVA